MALFWMVLTSSWPPRWGYAPSTPPAYTHTYRRLKAELWWWEVLGWLIHLISHLSWSSTSQDNSNSRQRLLLGCFFPPFPLNLENKTRGSNHACGQRGESSGLDLALSPGSYLSWNWSLLLLSGLSIWKKLWTVETILYSPSQSQYLSLR